MNEFFEFRVLDLGSDNQSWVSIGMVEEVGLVGFPLIFLTVDINGDSPVGTIN
jgi:hypothetical protein